MYKANLSYNQLNDNLAFLFSINLIVQANVSGKEVYLITNKGADFLQRHNELTKMLEPTQKVL
jgi:predicted transcriptional regulator